MSKFFEKQHLIKKTVQIYRLGNRNTKGAKTNFQRACSLQCIGTGFECSASRQHIVT
jgi:hypothetical protein